MNPSVLYYTEGGTTRMLAFTATMEEAHQGQSTVSKYPIQKGFQISNHMIRQNKVVNVKAVITNTDLGGVNATDASTGASIGNLVGLGGVGMVVGGVLSDPIGVASDYVGGMVDAAAEYVEPVFGIIDTAAKWLGEDINLSGVIDEYLTDPSRIQAALKSVQYIQDNGIICTLSTILKQYNNLVLVSYNTPSNTEYSNSIYLDLVFEQVIVTDGLGTVVGRVSPDIPAPAEQENLLEQAKQVGGKFIDKTKSFAEGIGEQFA